MPMTIQQVVEGYINVLPWKSPMRLPVATRWVATEIRLDPAKTAQGKL
jgi:hypothetical protein